ncbi:protein-disulfide reductase DsbD, partial [Pseudomonas syringae]|nr:protein-disulfide reductase DsbD [Pseudomonas syringae]
MRGLSRFEIAMRRLLCLMLLILALPVSASGLFDNRPASTLGGTSLDNSKDFLPVRQAFQLSLVDTTPESIKLRLV